MAEVVALDFDGVLCDGMDEYLLVSWLAYFERDQAGDSFALLATIPPSFRDHFARCRNFVRHSGHFIMPFLFQADFETQADFDAAYQSVDAETIKEFLKRFNARRARLREQQPEQWLALNPLYPGVGPALQTTRLPLFIVTGKDADSVLAILQAAGVNFEKDRVYGSLTDKLAAFHDIMRRTECKARSIAFYDDNVLNVAEARGDGLDGIWATWGYGSPEHRRIAEQRSIPSVDLEQFLKRLSA